MATQPNILLITTDHQRTDALGCYDSPWAHSPHIDALAAEGVQFEQCTCQSPSCTPSRASFWTGRYSHALGPAGFKSALPLPVPMLIRPFREAGYQCVQLGKFDSLLNHADEFDICEEGVGAGAAMGAWCTELPEGTDVDACQFLRSPTVNYVIGGINPQSPDETVCGIMAARAERFLQEEAQPPFFLRLSIDAPHMPFVPLPDFHGITDADRIDLPLPTPEELATKPQREIRHIRRFYGFDQLSPDQLRTCRSSFYDLCAELDDTIGRVLKALRDSRFGDNTIIVLHADHGTTLGEHGLGTIRSFYEPVVQVPYIWSWPGHLPEATRISDPVELIDTLPSLLDLAGLDCPAGVQGRSLVPQMLGRASDPDRPTFSEYDTALAPIGGQDWIPAEASWAPEHDRRVMIRRDGWKLECNYGPSDYGEDGALYDLRRDPFELDNLFARPECAAKIEELKTATQEWLACG